MGDFSEDTLEINKLKFYYDISTIKNMKASIGHSIIMEFPRTQKNKCTH